MEKPIFTSTSCFGESQQGQGGDSSLGGCVRPLPRGEPCIQGCPPLTQFPHPQYKPPTGVGWVTGMALGDPTATTQDHDHHGRATAWRRSRRRCWVPIVPPSPSVSFSPCLTAADAPALQEEGIKLGWRNFKDCCRPEGLRSPRGDGQSCRINPIGSLARLQPVQSSGRARGSAGGDAGGGSESPGASRRRWEINNEKLKAPIQPFTPLLPSPHQPGGGTRSGGGGGWILQSLRKTCLP